MELKKSYFTSKDQINWNQLKIYSLDLKYNSELTKELLEAVFDKFVIVSDVVHNSSQATDTTLHNPHAMFEDEFGHILLKLSQEVFTRMVHERNTLLQDSCNIV